MKNTYFAIKSTIGMYSDMRSCCNLRKGTFPVGDMNSAFGLSSNLYGKSAIFKKVCAATPSAY